MHSLIRCRCSGHAVLAVLALLLTLPACTKAQLPQRLESVDAEMDTIRGTVGEHTKLLNPSSAAGTVPASKADARNVRNRIVAARKYAIDLQYTEYENRLLAVIDGSQFASDAASIALHAAADLVPVEHTARMLNRIGTGTTALGTSFDDKVLLKHLVNDVILSMRTARDERAKVIFKNMRCSVKSYPLEMAQSDLESYYRAGTFETGLTKTSETLAEQRKKAGVEADAAKTGANGDDAAELAATAARATVKAQVAFEEAKAVAAGQPTKKKAKGMHRCTVDDFASTGLERDDG